MEFERPFEVRTPKRRQDHKNTFGRENFENGIEELDLLVQRKSRGLMWLRRKRMHTSWTDLFGQGKNVSCQAFFVMTSEYKNNRIHCHMMWATSANGGRSMKNVWMNEVLLIATQFSLTGVRWSSFCIFKHWNHSTIWVIEFNCYKRYEK